MMYMAQPITLPASLLLCQAQPQGVPHWVPQYLKADCNHSPPLYGINKWANSLMFPCDSFTPAVRLPPPTSGSLEFSNLEEDAVNFFLPQALQIPSYSTPKSVRQ